MKELVREAVAEALRQQRTCSVELGRSATGVTTILVKQYDESVDAAYQAANAAYQRACAEHPFVPKGK